MHHVHAACSTNIGYKTSIARLDFFKQTVGCVYVGVSVCVWCGGGGGGGVIIDTDWRCDFLIYRCLRYLDGLKLGFNKITGTPCTIHTTNVDNADI